MTRAGGLDGSELLTSALVPPDATDPPTTLAGVLREAIVDLARERGGAEHRRVLERTFLAGAPSQEAAAELLDLPFSTYRRHLARATDRLVEVLWAIELDAPAHLIDRPPVQHPLTGQQHAVETGQEVSTE